MVRFNIHVNWNDRVSEPQVDERDRQDYFAPSAQLFKRHCNAIVDRYDLQHVIRKAAVIDIDFGAVEHCGAENSVFTLSTTSGVLLAKTVVLAGGSFWPNPSPVVYPGVPVDSTIHVSRGEDICNLPNTCHSNDIIQFPDIETAQKMLENKSTSVLVIGGGLTGAQLADLAVRRGIRNVVLLTRSPMKSTAASTTESDY